MKRISIILTIIVWFFCVRTSFAQITPEWTTNYSANFPQSLDENDMVTDRNGNIYIVGFANDTSYNIRSVVLKYNTFGQFQWIQYHDSIRYYTRIAIDDSSNVYITGHFDDGLKTLKYNSLGALKWARTYPSSNFGGWAWDITTDDSSNVYVAGHSNGNRFTTLKYNTNGNLQWASLDTVANGQGPSLITIDNSKNIYVAVRGWDAINTAFTCTTIKYNKSGTKMWRRINNGNFTAGSAAPVDIKFHPDGFVYVLAYTTNNNSGQGDYHVIKYDTIGNQIWTFSHSFYTYYDVPKGFVLDKTGNVYVTGNIYPTGGTIDSIATIKISKSGVLKWKKTYSSGYWSLDEASGIAIDSLGYIYVAGKSSDNTNAENYVTIKYDSLGNLIWLARYKHTFSSSDIPNSISLDNSGNVYLSGTSREMNSSGILTIKYSNAVGINELSNNSSLLLNIFPNPFQSSFTIKSDKSLKDAELLLYDAFGKEVLKIDNINRKDILIQRNNLADGIYFFRLLENNQVIAKGKIIAD